MSVDDFAKEPTACRMCVTATQKYRRHFEIQERLCPEEVARRFHAIRTPGTQWKYTNLVLALCLDIRDSLLTPVLRYVLINDRNKDQVQFILEPSLDENGQYSGNVLFCATTDDDAKKYNIPRHKYFIDFISARKVVTWSERTRAASTANAYRKSSVIAH